MQILLIITARSNTTFSYLSTWYHVKLLTYKKLASIGETGCAQFPTFILKITAGKALYKAQLDASLTLWVELFGTAAGCTWAWWRLFEPRLWLESRFKISHKYLPICWADVKFKSFKSRLSESDVFFVRDATEQVRRAQLGSLCH